MSYVPDVPAQDSRSPRPPSITTEVRSTPLSLDECVAAVSAPAAGGIAVFLGTVREQDDDQAVDRLEYAAHPSAEAELARVAAAVAADVPVVALAAQHRVGDLAIGDIAVVVAASAAHRGEAFTACRRLIDDLKATVPIWKHQMFTDGQAEWVGSP
ncbi:MAG: molybdopterin synthase catalytic subunit [Frankiaceae bacterium]|nr:molybdopterin synthase catalytic subunit [Frankiaceae bacterium]